MKKNSLFLFILLCLAFHYTIEAAPAQVIIIAPAEKSLKEASLSTKGRQRAQAFIPYFIETKQFLRAGPITSIYTCKSTKEALSNYFIETVMPLSNALNITVNDRHMAADFKNLVSEIMNDSLVDAKTILICWDSQFIPEIARAFKALQTPYKWNSSIVDHVWLISIERSGKATCNNIAMHLMFGDLN